jgi:hypothetical protein
MLLALAGWAGQRNVNVDVVPLVAANEQCSDRVWGRRRDRCHTWAHYHWSGWLVFWSYDRRAA